MTLNHSTDTIFIKKLTKIVEANLANENFGVNELVDKLGLSRSQIHRRLKKSTNKSLSQFIREIRLEKGKELLEKDSGTVSEIAYNVGFGSPSYFIKSFHDYFGYPPVEYLKYASAETVKEKNETAANGNLQESIDGKSSNKTSSVINKKALIIVITVAIMISGIFVVNKIGNKDLSIAVLPPENLTGQDNIEHITYGVQAGLIGKLGELEELRVISQWSTREFKDTNMSFKDIAKTLNVNLLLVPRLISVSDHMEIELNLVDVSKEERNIWTNKYETNMRNILQFYSSVTREIAQELHLDLTDDVKRRLSQIRKVNPESWAAYYRGLNLLGKDNVELVNDGIQCLLELTEKDPADPFANAAVAIGYAIKGHNYGRKPKESFIRAGFFADRALKLDSTIDEAYTAKAMLYLYQGWEWDKAKEAFTEALRINPSNDIAYAHFAWYYQVHGDYEKAIYHAERAVTLNPLYIAYNAWLAAIYYGAKEYDKAEIYAKKVLAKKDSSVYANIILGFTNLLQKNYPEAIMHTEKLPMKWDYFNLYRAYVYDKSGDKEKALTFRNAMEAEAEAKTKYVPHWRRGLMAAIFGDKEEAFKYLNLAIDEKQYQAMYINWYPFTESIRSDPRYNELLKRMNLPPYFPKPSE